MIEAITPFELKDDLVARHPRQNKAMPDEIDCLKAALLYANEATTLFITCFKPQHGQSGNHDPLTRTFIAEIFDLWLSLVPVEGFRDVEGFRGDDRLFKRLLTAAWRDLRLPTKDHNGQRLEEWLADRVRKQFPEGILNTRMDRQRYESWKLGLRSSPD